MDDLVRWLGKQLDEDERIVRAATPGPWVWTPETDVWDQNGPTLIREGTDASDAELVEVAVGWGHDAWGMHISDADRAHIAEWDPARVLREINAKRQILDRYAKAVHVLSRFGEIEESHVAAKEVVILSWVLKAMALPYADRPGYREDWRP